MTGAMEYVHVDKSNVLALKNGATALEDSLVVLGPRRRHQVLLKVTRLDVVHNVEQRVHARGVARKLHDFPVRKHDAAKGVRGREQHAAVGHKRLGAVAHVQAGLAAGELDKNGDGA